MLGSFTEVNLNDKLRHLLQTEPRTISVNFNNNNNSNNNNINRFTAIIKSHCSYSYCYPLSRYLYLSVYLLPRVLLILSE